MARAEDADGPKTTVELTVLEPEEPPAISIDEEDM